MVHSAESEATRLKSPHLAIQKNSFSEKEGNQIETTDTNCFFFPLACCTVFKKKGGGKEEKIRKGFCLSH